MQEYLYPAPKSNSEGCHVIIIIIIKNVKIRVTLS